MINTLLTYDQYSCQVPFVMSSYQLIKIYTKNYGTMCWQKMVLGENWLVLAWPVYIYNYIFVNGVACRQSQNHYIFLSQKADTSICQSFVITTENHCKYIRQYVQYVSLEYDLNHIFLYVINNKVAFLC